SKGGRMEMITGPTGGLDHDALAKNIERDLEHLIDNDTLSPETRELLAGLKRMDRKKRHRAIEVLIAGKRRVGGKTTILSVLKKEDYNGDLVFETDELHKLNKHLNVARKELFTYLGLQDVDDITSFKMSKSDPDSGIYLHDGEDDIRRKIKKAWCPEGVPDNPVMEICKTILFPTKGEMHFKRPEKWGGDLHFESYDELRAVFTKKQLHPADLKKEVANQLVKILKPFRDYFKKKPDILNIVKAHAKAMSR
ncbi:MAG: hypothetical protein U9R75_11355, partial [Candidatus Thermoplasmatota archaeon]|nr:hypothetical protein [Candidatus Thermoplasmatota archaeon]